MLRYDRSFMSLWTASVGVVPCVRMFIVLRHRGRITAGTAQ